MSRALGAALLALLCGLLLSYAPLLLPARPSDAMLLATRAVGLGVVLLLVRAVLAPMVQRTPAELGMAMSPRTLSRFALGMAAGAGVLLLAFFVAWGAGGFTVAPGMDVRSGQQVALDLGMFFVAACYEEICYRVGLLGVLRTAVRPALAVGASAAVFGLLHANNPGAGTLAVVNTMLAGVLLGVLFLERRGAPQIPSLGLCTGFHFAWNVTQGELLGIPVSGYIGNSRVLALESLRVEWSGGDYGLEAGYGVTIALALACILATRNADLSAARGVPS